VCVLVGGERGGGVGALVGSGLRSHPRPACNAPHCSSSTNPPNSTPQTPQPKPTQAGLRGINLSGGQRQRLNLARCAYFNGDLVLLDNALSAVDHHTAQHIFEHCVRGIFRDKATVLITHQVGGWWGLGFRVWVWLFWGLLRLGVWNVLCSALIFYCWIQLVV